MNKSNLQFEGYVLAGGKSSRMKTDKAFLKFDGETFLERAARTLKIACENRVKIVLNANQTDFVEKLPPETGHIFDRFENRGALGGIHAALKDCRLNYAIILACDMPFVTRETIENLAIIALETEEFSAIIPRQTDGKAQPLCAVYSVRKCLPELEKYLSENSSNAVKDFLNFINPKFVEADLIDSNKNFLFNVNRPPDYNFLSEN